MPQPSEKAVQFTESVIRKMTRLAKEHGAVNLGQGFPDFSAPAEIKDAACRAIVPPQPRASSSGWAAITSTLMNAPPSARCTGSPRCRNRG